jgi:hypothetical protein
VPCSLRTIALALTACTACHWAFPLEDRCSGFAVGASRYVQLPEDRMFAGAAESCHSEGLHLIVLGGDDERETVAAQLGSDSVWIGLHDRNSEGIFVVVSDEDVNDYPPDPGPAWVGGRSEDGGPDCVKLLPSGLIENVACMETRPALCECDAYEGEINWQ